MSTLCASSSTKGTVLSKVAPRQVLSFLYPSELSSQALSRTRSLPKFRIPPRKVPTTISLEAWFLNSLSNAAHCRQHRPSPQTLYKFFTSHTSEYSTKRRHTYGASFQRQKHTQRLSSGKDTALKSEPTRKDLLASYRPASVGEEVESESESGFEFTDEEEAPLRNELDEENVDIAPQPQRLPKEPLASYSPFLDTQEEQNVQLNEQDGTIRAELLALIDPYHDDYIPYEPPRRYQPADGPHLTVSDKAEDEWPPPNKEWSAGSDTASILDLLDNTLRVISTDPEVTYQIYRTLPEPRAPYLSSQLRHRLLHHLSAVEEKNGDSMLRYLSVVDDMKSSAIPLLSSEWNSVISFVARYVARSTEVEVEAALKAWREMEYNAGVKADTCTFNILFDVASKAGQFTLAEMIHREMHSRGIEFDRYSHVGLIHFHGLRQDGDGVRAAFKALESAGEVIDNVVLNSLIYSFVHCHEATSAIAVYNFMKARVEINPLVLGDFRARKEIARVLKIWASYIKNRPHTREAFQENTPMAPNFRTFRILFKYFGVKLGDLQQVANLVDDSIQLNIPLRGTHFLSLFQGFAQHGGIRYTKWTLPLLERTYTSFLDALDGQPIQYGVHNKSNVLYMSKFMALSVLTAFSKCSGRSRTLEVWEELKERWKPDEDELDFMLTSMHQLFQGAETDVLVGHPSWILGV
jgi:pentatricopeptide repeat protein